MTTLLYFTDPHISQSHGLGGANQRMPGLHTQSLAEGHRALAWVLDLARERYPDLIVCGGDVYDRPNPTPNEESVVLEAFGELAEIAPTYVILGNHTQSHSGDRDALASLRASGHGVRVFDSPTHYDAEGIRMYALPYPPLGGAGGSAEDANRNTSQALGAILTDFANDASECDRPTVLLPHVTFGGAQYESGRTVPSTDVRVPTGRLADFDMTLAGHIHKRQRIGGLDERAQYIGPPYRWSFADEGNPVGAAIAEWPESGEMRLDIAQRTDALTFETIAPDEGCEPDSRTVVRVRGELRDLEAMRETEDRIEGLRESAAAVRNELTLAAGDREYDDTDLEDHTLREVYDRYCERTDDIPEGDQDDVFATVQSTLDDLE